MKTWKHDQLRAVVSLVLTALGSLATGASEPVSRSDSFHAFTWSEVPTECQHLTPMLWFKVESDPRQIAARSLAFPAGRRALFSWDLHRGLLGHPGDVCKTPTGEPTSHRGVWPEQGVAEVRKKFDEFFRVFKEAGGQVDWLILDFEEGYSNWQIGGRSASERWMAIRNDPRFPALARQLGFADLMTVADWNKGKNYLVWNAQAGALVDDALNRAVFETVRRHFPRVRCSNYGSASVTEPNAMPDLNGHWTWRKGAAVGTHQAPSCYASIGQLAARKLDGRNAFGQSPFAGLLLELNSVRAVRRSSALPLQPWVAWQRYKGDGPGHPPAVIGGTPYYRELVLHLALAGADGFLFWNPHSWKPTQPPEEMSMPADERLLNGFLGELQSRFGLAPRRALTLESIPWDTRVIASAMQAGGDVIWRFTFTPGLSHLPATLNGRPVALKPAAGEVGAWFTHPVGQQLQFGTE